MKRLKIILPPLAVALLAEGGEHGVISYRCPRTGGVRTAIATGEKRGRKVRVIECNIRHSCKWIAESSIIAAQNKPKNSLKKKQKRA